jgi:putative membrane protein insertion efficiency factor
VLSVAFKRVILAILRLYRFVVSPLLPPSCRFTPSCSEYAVMSVERFGVLRGGWLAVQRVLKCHPWGPAGLDPVPQPSEKE